MHGDDAAALGDALRDGHGEDLFALTEVRARETAPSALATSRRAAKALLLDQSIVAGIGNYLADEALWEQAIAPTRELEVEAWVRLIGSARAVAEGALRLGGVSVRDYVRVDGSEGEGRSSCAATGAPGQPCLRCGTKLAKSKVAGRGTTSCPRCQRA